MVYTRIARDRSEDTGAHRLELRVEQNNGVAVKTDERAVGTTHAFGGADHNSVVDLTLLDATARGSFFYRHLDDVTDVCIAALGAAQHLKTHY